MRPNVGVEHGLNFMGDAMDIQRLIPVEVGGGLGDERVKLHVIRKWTSLRSRHKRVEETDELPDQHEKLGSELLVLQFCDAGIDVNLEVDSAMNAGVRKVFDDGVAGLT